MQYFAVGLGLWLHLFFWGAGLAWLLTPRRWRMLWPLVALVGGASLQSAVVWAGAHTAWEGTNVYAIWAEGIPAVLLLVAWRRSRGLAFSAVLRNAGVLALSILILVAALFPFSRSGGGLTTSSLGSCDAADYAAGARVLGEFSRYDRSGFLGHTEVVQVHSVDNFFDYWTRLNHFTPSALIAFNATIFDLRPHQLVSVVTALFLALGVPVAYLLARWTFGYSRTVSFGLATAYGLSPLLWYALGHAAMSQLMVAPVIAGLTAVGVHLCRWGHRARAGWAFFGWMFLAHWLLLGSYNFIVAVALVPATGYALLWAINRGEWRGLTRWVLQMASPLAAAAVVFNERILGLWERIRLFREYDFGWRIPGLTPETWVGFVADARLSAPPTALRVTLVVLLVVLWLLAIVRARRHPRVALCVAAVLPIAAGYGYLYYRGEILRTNASYDAYKLLSVFLPGILASLALPLASFRRRMRLGYGVALILACASVGASTIAVVRFTKRLTVTPLKVQPALVALQDLERREDILSVNLLITDFWDRLWANAFLLRKPQYFPTHTYEGRKNTELRGSHDVLGGLVSIRLPDTHDPIVGGVYTVVDTRSPYFVRLSPGANWYEPERGMGDARWRWSAGDASVLIDNPQGHPLTVSFRLAARSLAERQLGVHFRDLLAGEFRVGTQVSVGEVKGLLVPPGKNEIFFRSDVPPIVPGPGDKRALGFATYGLEVHVTKESRPSDTPRT